MRVLLDTNVIVSGIAYPNGSPGRIVTAWRAGAFDVVLSEYILDEVDRVLPRLGRASALTEAERSAIVAGLRRLALQIAADEELTRTPATVRDPKDNPILALLLTPKFGIDWLVTGDGDLKDLRAVHPILSPAEFCARFLG